MRFKGVSRDWTSSWGIRWNFRSACTKEHPEFLFFSSHQNTDENSFPSTANNSWDCTNLKLGEPVNSKTCRVSYAKRCPGWHNNRTHHPGWFKVNRAPSLEEDGKMEQSGTCIRPWQTLATLKKKGGTMWDHRLPSHWIPSCKSKVAETDRLKWNSSCSLCCDDFSNNRKKKKCCFSSFGGVSFVGFNFVRRQQSGKNLFQRRKFLTLNQPVPLLPTVLRGTKVSRPVVHNFGENCCAVRGRRLCGLRCSTMVPDPLRTHRSVSRDYLGWRPQRGTCCWSASRTCGASPASAGRRLCALEVRVSGPCSCRPSQTYVGALQWSSSGVLLAFLHSKPPSKDWQQSFGPLAQVHTMTNEMTQGIEKLRTKLNAAFLHIRVEFSTYFPGCASWGCSCPRPLTESTCSGTETWASTVSWFVLFNLQDWTHEETL